MNEDSNQLQGNISNYYYIVITGGEGGGWVGGKIALNCKLFFFLDGSKQFPAFFNTLTFTDQYFDSFSDDETVIISNRCPITAEQDMIIILLLW